MNNLKFIRENREIKQIELAMVLQTTQQQYSLYETGKRELRETQIIKICQYLKISADELLCIK